MTDAATASAPTMSTSVTTVSTSPPTMSTTATAVTTSAPTMSTTVTTVTTAAPTMSTTATAVTKSASTMSTIATAVTKSASTMSTTAASTHRALKVTAKVVADIKSTLQTTNNRIQSTRSSDSIMMTMFGLGLTTRLERNTLFGLQLFTTLGDPVNYTHWYPGRKASTLQSDEDCVAIWIAHGGQWEDVLCSGLHAINLGYVCEFDSVVGAAAPINPDALINTDGNTQSCPHITTAIVAQFGKSCYALYHNLEAWSKAEQTCKLKGGHLVHINDDPEQQFIEGFMRRHNQMTPAWIGLSDTSVEGRFVWTDGMAASYTNWLPGHVTHGSTEDCVALLPNINGTWDDFRCELSSLFSTLGDHHHPLCEYAHTIASVLVG